MAYLTMVDRSYRGTVEAQFCDVFLEILALYQQVGSVDVVLRGNAVTTALAAVRQTPDHPPHPRDWVDTMVAEGIAVYVDEPGLRALGLDAGALRPGVACLDTTELAHRWASYDQVWFL
jgi:hypothetical protein